MGEKNLFFDINVKAPLGPFWTSISWTI